MKRGNSSENLKYVDSGCDVGHLSVLFRLATESNASRHQATIARRQRRRCVEGRAPD